MDDRMRLRAALFGLLIGVVAAAGAQAQPSRWVQLATVTGEGVYYVDRQTAGEPYGRFVRLWTLQDLQEAHSLEDGARYRSVTASWLVNCKTRSHAFRAGHFYASSMGTGGPIFSTSPVPDERLRFRDPVPGSTGEKMVAFACR